MKRLSILLISGLMVLTFQTRAQMKLGVKVGLNLDNVAFNYAESDMEPDPQMRPDMHFGVLLHLGTCKAGLDFQTGLILSRQGYVLEDDGDNYESRDHVCMGYLKLPLHAIYKAGDFRAYAGPYVGFGTSGQNTWETTVGETTDDGVIKIKPVFGEIKDGDLADDEDAYNAFDYGLNAGIGYQVGPILIDAGYSFGFGNITPAFEGIEPKDWKASNRVITVSLNYFFGNKKN